METKTYTREEQAANRLLWIKELREGGHKQIVGSLGRLESGMCCLGVASHLAVRVGAVDAYEPNRGFVSPEVCDWLGLAESDGPLVGGRSGESLILLNDVEGFTFAQIADVIEAGEVAVQ